MSQNQPTSWLSISRSLEAKWMCLGVGGDGKVICSKTKGLSFLKIWNLRSEIAAFIITSFFLPLCRFRNPSSHLDWLRSTKLRVCLVRSPCCQASWTASLAAALPPSQHILRSQSDKLKPILGTCDCHTKQSLHHERAGSNSTHWRGKREARACWPF